MNHVSEHIIFVLYIDCIILKGCCIYFYCNAGKHFNDCRFQPIIIHVDQWHYRIIGSCFRPVTFKFSTLHHRNNCSWIINLITFQQITIVPFFYFIKILMIFFCKPSDFFFRKSYIRSKIACTQHCKFIKIIQCRLCFLFFNWQNSCQICQQNIFCRFRSFKDSSQKINIFILNLFARCFISDQRIPLIYNNDKSVSRCCINIRKCPVYCICFFHRYIRIIFFQFRNQIIIDIFHGCFR